MSYFSRMVARCVAASVALGAISLTAQADEIFYAMGGGVGPANLKKVVEPWEKQTGHTVTVVPMPASTNDQFAQYRVWLSAGTSDIDVYNTDVIWPPQFADFFVDLSEAGKDLIPQHFSAVMQAQTVDGKVVAMPIYTDVSSLYYRRDLLEKYNLPVPQTWEEFTKTAQTIQDGERADGNADFWGFVFQGNSYEGLTCDALEWVASYGGGSIVEPDGSVSINNEHAVTALKMGASWVGTISPRGVLSYKEEEARGIFQSGNAAFMRNWTYVNALLGGDDSAVKGKYGIAALPAGSAGSVSTIGGWGSSVSKFSTKQEAAISLALYLGSPEGQKRWVMATSNTPTIASLYEDPDLIKLVPALPQWRDVFLNSTLPRPSAQTKGKYNEVSNKFWEAAYAVISGQGEAEEILEILEEDLLEIKGSGW